MHTFAWKAILMHNNSTRWRSGIHNISADAVGVNLFHYYLLLPCWISVVMAICWPYVICMRWASAPQVKDAQQRALLGGRNSTHSQRLAPSSLIIHCSRRRAAAAAKICDRQLREPRSAERRTLDRHYRTLARRWLYVASPHYCRQSGCSVSENYAINSSM